MYADIPTTCHIRTANSSQYGCYSHKCPDSGRWHYPNHVSQLQCAGEAHGAGGDYKCTGNQDCPGLDCHSRKTSEYFHQANSSSAEELCCAVDQQCLLVHCHTNDIDVYCRQNRICNNLDLNGRACHDNGYRCIGDRHPGHHHNSDRNNRRHCYHGKPAYTNTSASDAAQELTHSLPQTTTTTLPASTVYPPDAAYCSGGDITGNGIGAAYVPECDSSYLSYADAAGFSYYYETVTTYDDCLNACDNDALCVAFSFLKNTCTNNCFVLDQTDLSNGYPTPSPDPTVDSGVFNGITV